MRVTKQLMQKKEKFGVQYWQRFPDVSPKRVNEAIAKKFGSGMHMTRIGELRKQAEKQSSKEPPKPPVAEKVGSPRAQSVSVVAKCAHCGKKGDAEKLFGYRTVNGAKKVQSWCRECRAGARNQDEAKPVVNARNVVSKPVTKTTKPTNGEILADAPRSVVVAAHALLAEMRKNRVVEASLDASGTTKFKVLKPDVAEIHFGGRREGDPKATVNLNLLH